MTQAQVALQRALKVFSTLLLSTALPLEGYHWLLERSIEVDTSGNPLAAFFGRLPFWMVFVMGAAAAVWFNKFIEGKGLFSDNPSDEFIFNNSPTYYTLAVLLLLVCVLLIERILFRIG